MRRKIKIDKHNHPPIGIWGGTVHAYERCLDPWHSEAFPGQFKNSAPHCGVRKEGWAALNAFNDIVGFFPDGDIF